MGVRVTPGSAPPPVAGGPAVPGAGAPKRASTRTLSRRGVKLVVPRSITWRQLKKGFRIRISARKGSRVALGIRRKGTRRVSCGPAGR